MNRKLTKKEAIDLFRQMWTDMQKELGDNPDHLSRYWFKGKWCKKHFPDETITSNCPLCEYAYRKYQANGYKGSSCRFCPIKWPIPNIPVPPCCQGLEIHYLSSPISVILALPEREVPDEDRLQNNKSSDEKGARDDTNETI